jgi:hypothetical protein
LRRHDKDPSSGSSHRSGKDRDRDGIRGGQTGWTLDITSTINGDRYAAGRVPIGAQLVFTANDCLDIGACLGGPVSLDFDGVVPFPFDGTIQDVDVRYIS